MRNHNAFKVASIYIGTVIGAGFASGQEMIQFFTKYGKQGIYGVILTTFLLSLVGSFILLKVYNHCITSYREWLDYAFGSHIGGIIESILLIVIFCGYCIMLAGSGALIQEHFGCGVKVGIVVMSMVTFMTFLFHMRGLTFINVVVVPILLFGIILMGIKIIAYNGMMISYEVGTIENRITENWILSSLLYVGYNSINAMMVMSSLLPLLDHKKVAIKGGVMGGIGLGLMAIFLLLSTLILYTDIQGTEVPMMAIASRFGKRTELFYGIVLWFAMLTTAIANGFVFLQGVKKKFNIRSTILCVLFCLGTIPFAHFGFKNLVGILYPVFGYVGILIIFLVTCRNLHINE